MIQLTISYEFPQKTAADLDELNAVLEKLPLSGLSMEDEEGYRAITRDGSDKIIGLRYGLGSGKLICTPPTPDERHIYRIETYMFERPFGESTDEFRNWWNSCHPGRIARTTITSDWNDGMQSVIVLSHEQNENHSVSYFV